MTSDRCCDLLTRFIVISDFCNDGHSDSVHDSSLLRLYWLCEVYYVRLLVVFSIVPYD